MLGSCVAVVLLALIVAWPSHDETARRRSCVSNEKFDAATVADVLSRHVIHLKSD